MQKNEVTIDDSNQYTNKFIGGDSARKKAEDIAKEYLGTIVGSLKLEEMNKVFGSLKKGN